MSHQLDCLGQQTDDNFLLDSRLLVENAPNTVVSNSSTFPGSSNILILEQPASLVRFRYESEGLYPTQGATSTAMKKTFPTIQIANFDRLATVIVSCVTKDQPYRPHPHCLAGDDCKWGVYQKQVHSSVISFQKLSVQFTKRKHIEEVMLVRQQKNIDPFQTGFDHCKQLDLESIDLDAIRLCFQVFTLTKKKFESKTEKNLADKHWKQLGVAVSEPIYNKKACTNLKILKLSHSSAFVDGGKEILMFCEKVVKDDVEIRFFEQRDQTGPVEWEALGQFHPSNVHKGFGIAFRTPPYKTLEVEAPVDVFIQLRRPSDNSVGDAVPFQLRPPECLSFRQKRRKCAADSNLNRRLQGITQSTPTSKMMCSGSDTFYGGNNVVYDAPVSQQQQPPPSQLSYSDSYGPVFQHSNLLNLNSYTEEQANSLSLDPLAQISNRQGLNTVSDMIEPSMAVTSLLHYPDPSSCSLTSTSPHLLRSQEEYFSGMSRDWIEKKEAAYPPSEKLLPISSAYHESGKSHAPGFNVEELNAEQTAQACDKIVNNATYNNNIPVLQSQKDEYSVIDNLSGLLEDLKY